VSPRVLLAGGGLANALLAHRLATLRPEVDLLLLERGATLGGNHVWSFHEADLTKAQREWMAPFVVRRWPGYEVRFPSRRRRLEGAYHAVTSTRLHEVIAAGLGPRVRPGAEILEVGPREIRLAGGETLAGDAVVDGRGDLDSGALIMAYQKFLGYRLRLESGHDLEVPILMDATVEQRDGFRFLYTLPFGERELLVEDTRYSDGPALDRDEMRAEVLDYAAAQGWTVGEVEGEEEGVLPIVLGGDFDAFWAAGPAGVPRAGLRAGLFHPTTGYSLPEAVRLADDLAARERLDSEVLHHWIQARSRRLWRQDTYLRFLNRMLFLAAKPPERYRVMQRFYGLPVPLIERFYAGRLTPADRVRILVGKPPVPVLRALRCLKEPRRASGSAGPG
jgi:lycopene beta-cyclase